MPTLRELREQKVMSQRDLAAAAHVSSRTIDRLENGVHYPTFKVIRKLAFGLGVEPGLIQFKPANTSLVVRNKQLQETSNQETYEQFEDRILKRLDDKINALALVLAKEMLNVRFWTGAHEIDINILTSSMRKALSAIGYLGKDQKFQGKVVDSSEEEARKFRDRVWPGIPMPGEPGFKNAKNIIHGESLLEMQTRIMTAYQQFVNSDSQMGDNK